MSPGPPDASLPAQLGEFHAKLPLAGGRPNAVLALPDDRILSLAAVLRDKPGAAPALSPEEWRESLDPPRPHGAYVPLADRLSAWPEDCRPPAEVMDVLKRQHLLAAARSMRAGQPTALYFRGSSIHRATGSQATVRTGSLFRGSLYASFHQEEERTMVDGRIATARRRVTLEELKTALRALLPSLEREYGVTSIKLFGSYVRGEQDEESDLDLLVEFEPDSDLSLFDFARLQRTLGESLGVRVDLVEKRSIKPRLRDRILHEAIPL